MSATFQPARGPDDLRPIVRCTCPDDAPLTCPACLLALNVNERDAAALLEHIGLNPAPSGAIEAYRLTTLCKLRLAMYDAEGDIPAQARGRVVVGGRAAGKLRACTAQLLTIARAAGDGWVGWS